MNNENKGMQLRQRRVLADISNKAAVAPAAVEILPKKQKRRVSYDLGLCFELKKRCRYLC